jgi:hypothetical protein
MNSLVFVVLHHSTDYFHIVLLENCLKSIRTLYPTNRILIVKTSESILPDTFQKEYTVEIQNTPQDGSTVMGGIYRIVQDKSIENYMLIHDSMYIIKPLPETILDKSLYFMWHFHGLRENHKARIQEFLSFSKFTECEKEKILDMYETDPTWISCFGGSVGGSRHSLEILASKLNIVDNIHRFTKTPDIMCFERYLACAIYTLDLYTPFESTYTLNGCTSHIPYAGQFLSDIDLETIKNIPYSGYMFKLYLARSLIE